MRTPCWRLATPPAEAINAAADNAAAAVSAAAAKILLGAFGRLHGCPAAAAAVSVAGGDTAERAAEGGGEGEGGGKGEGGGEAGGMAAAAKRAGAGLPTSVSHVDAAVWAAESFLGAEDVAALLLDE
jgi:hypothetical protein